MQEYGYEISGGASGDQTWTAKGAVCVARPGQFGQVPTLALANAFHALTTGRAVYGKPGVGCAGPYIVSRMTISLRGADAPASAARLARALIAKMKEVEAGTRTKDGRYRTPDSNDWCDLWHAIRTTIETLTPDVDTAAIGGEPDRRAS